MILMRNLSTLWCLISSVYCKLSHRTREISTNKREIKSMSGQYAAYLLVIRVIPRLSGELLEPNRACDRRHREGEKGATQDEGTRGRREQRMPCRLSRSSRDARGTREGARWMILRGRFDGVWNRSKVDRRKGKRGERERRRIRRRPDQSEARESSKR